MSRVHELIARVKVLEDRLTETEKDVDTWSRELSSVTGPRFDQLVEKISLSRMKADVTRGQVDQAKDDLETEQARLSSSGYVDDVRKLAGMEKVLDKKADKISKAYDELREMITDFDTGCKDYDRLARSLDLVGPNTWKMSSYSWVLYLYTHMSKMARRS